MRFSEVLKETLWLLLTERQLSYERLRLEFELDDRRLEALRRELIHLKGVAADRDQRFLVWAGPGGASSAMPEPDGASTLPPLMPPTDGARLQDAEASVVSGDPLASDAERRLLTVMFCDLAESTALSRRLDPEDLQDVIRSYRELCAGVIGEFDGFIAKYMGDGILVYFGYPRAQERNAERALRCAVSITDAMAGLNQTLRHEMGIEVAVRIGIATGMVMVGEMVGEGVARERTVIGEAPNLAARLQDLAQKNEIVIGTLTRDLAGRSLIYEDLGMRDLKGIAGRTRVWRVAGLAADVTSVLGGAVGSDQGTAPLLVGRDQEAALLRRAWQTVGREGHGQVVAVTGEAGIGKSALVEDLAASVRVDGVPVTTFRCSPHHTNSALHPMIEHLKGLAGWRQGDSPDARRNKLEALVGRYSLPFAESVQLLADLVSLPLPVERYQPLGLTPHERKHQTLDALVALTLEEAERQPLLQVWHDLHWADPTTLDLLGSIIEQVPTARLLLVLTSRPDFAWPWPPRSHVTPVALNRLDQRQSKAVIARVAGRKPLPDEVIDHIVAKADGVPLYVEELTKAIQASGILRETGETLELTGPLSALSIPETLQESLMARLDRLPEVREIAQICSVLGREFAYEMIAGLSAMSEGGLQGGLGQLVQAELLYQRGRPPRARYMFKHALVQDAAYESLLRRTRQQFHHRVAELLEHRFPETAETSPELVAHHYTEAGDAKQAVGYWYAAGRRAVERSANTEAVGHLTHGLQLVSGVRDSAERDRYELDLLTTLGPALIATRGYGADAVKTTYARTKALADRIGDDTTVFTALRGQWNALLFSALLAESRDRAEDLRHLADKIDDPGYRVEACRLQTTAAFYLGAFDDARAFAAQGLELYDPEHHHELALVFGADPGIVCRLYGGLSLWMLGYPDRAEREISAAIALTRQHGHRHTEAFALCFQSIHCQFRRDAQGALEWARLTTEVASRLGIRQWLAWSMVIAGWAQALLEDPDDGLRQLDAGMAHWQAPSPEFMLPYFLILKAEILINEARLDEALGALEEAQRLAEKNGEAAIKAEIFRLRGEALSRQPDAPGEAVDACFTQALDVARRQSARSHELRAAMGFHRVMKEHGRRDEAYRPLAEAYGRFEEGFQTPDLLEARRLLEDFEGRDVA